MAKNYRDVNYWETKPEIVKIFDDLEAFHDFCRFEMAPFNEADLYNNRSWVWRNFADKNRKFRTSKPYFKKNFTSRQNG
jgi:hypothetical protein